jgi:hypothetical protein
MGVALQAHRLALGGDMKRIGSTGLIFLSTAQLSLTPGLPALAADAPSLQAEIRMYFALDENLIHLRRFRAEPHQTWAAATAAA